MLGQHRISLASQACWKKWLLLNSFSTVHQGRGGQGWGLGEMCCGELARTAGAADDASRIVAAAQHLPLVMAGALPSHRPPHPHAPPPPSRMGAPHRAKSAPILQPLQPQAVGVTLRDLREAGWVGPTHPSPCVSRAQAPPPVRAAQGIRRASIAAMVAVMEVANSAGAWTAVAVGMWAHRPASGSPCSPSQY